MYTSNRCYLPRAGGYSYVATGAVPYRNDVINIPTYDDSITFPNGLIRNAEDEFSFQFCENR